MVKRKNGKEETMHDLSLVAIFRNENSWLDEWIQYHHALGVEHFYLFNDDEDSRVSDRILQPYVEQGLVENLSLKQLKEISSVARQWLQLKTYEFVFQYAAGKTKWLAIIDLDEFMLPKQYDDLRELLVNYERYPALAMHWQIFGTSGSIKRPPTQINHLLYRAEENWWSNRYFKSIVQPERVLWEKLYDVHHFPCRDGETVNGNHEPVSGLQCDVTTNVIQLNHYCLRSWQDFWEVKFHRSRFNYAGMFDPNYFERHDRNEVFDDEISRRFGHVISQQSIQEQTK
jgi:hypothetical protein